MFALVLAASLAAAPAPRAATASATVVHIPRLDAIQGVTAFLDRAGQHAALLRPIVWYAELHPWLSLDPSQPEALAGLGIDPSGPVTVSLRANGRISCTRLKDPKLFQDKAAGVLVSGSGKTEVKPTTSGGVTTVSIPRESGGHAGYALKGQEVCAFATTGGGFVDDGQGAAMVKEASRLVGKAPKPDARLGQLPGSVYVLLPGRGMVVGMEGSATELRLEGTATQLPLPPFQTTGTSPYGTMKSEGMLFSRARVAPAGVEQAVGSVRALVQQACPACPPAEVSSVARAVSERLTGNVLVMVDSVRSRPNLRTREGRFFAPRQAVAAEVTDAAAMKTALAPVAKFPGVKPLEDGYALDVKGGTLFVRLKGKQLVMGNDEAVAQSLLGAVPQTGAKLPHAVDFTVDPKRLANGLNQVSLMDVVSDQQLAGLFTVGLELGPLLARSERISGWLDSTGGGHRFSTLWTLPAAP
ncbi:hypothetical protein ATI61_120101 [Archangium gephyra]|uniref:Uncharacterized protein n=1 Tax=Archangium gephyra TaxID=48 RepID=A0AAC8TCF4_9BACT|nr:hypothetical protein [Archangium gephyra]AKJ00702.1 Hypothetical protein AA314_02328 [Archangium gephyra]REG20745.1 hypothetical protein ATI61_120101 [Archangium gephyra]